MTHLFFALPVLMPCSRCNGAGAFAAHAHVSGGACFLCKGAELRAAGKRGFNWRTASREDRIEGIAQALAWLDLPHGAARAAAVAAYVGVILAACPESDADVVARARAAFAARVKIAA